MKDSIATKVCGTCKSAERTVGCRVLCTSKEYAHYASPEEQAEFEEKGFVDLLRVDAYEGFFSDCTFYESREASNRRDGGVDTMITLATKVCGTCKSAQEICFPPSPGGPEDGVLCTNAQFVQFGFPEELEDFEEQGSVNIWRMEVVAPGVDCFFYEQKEVSKVSTVRKTLRSFLTIASRVRLP